MARSLSGGQSPIATADLVAGLIRADAPEPVPPAAKGARRGKEVPEAPRRQTTVTMPEEYHRALDLRCWGMRGSGSKGSTKSQIIMEALDAYLAEELETARRLGDS